MKIEKVKKFVKSEMEGVCTAHDFAHILRVYKLSEIIYESEKQWDKEVIWIAALLHEFLDEKFFRSVLDIQKEKLLQLLNDIWCTSEQKEKILFIVSNIWYGKSLSRIEPINMIEFCIIEDADRLESTGAISIARTFVYGGKKWIPIHDPEIEFNRELDEKSYWNSATSINHFFEKLLKIKFLMNTQKWKEIAEEKHNFLELYLKTFLDEWNI